MAQVKTMKLVALSGKSVATICIGKHVQNQYRYTTYSTPHNNLSWEPPTPTPFIDAEIYATGKLGSNSLKNRRCRRQTLPLNHGVALPLDCQLLGFQAILSLSSFQQFSWDAMYGSCKGPGCFMACGRHNSVATGNS